MASLVDSLALVSQQLASLAEHASDTAVRHAASCSSADSMMGEALHQLFVAMERSPSAVHAPERLLRLVQSAHRIFSTLGQQDSQATR